MSNRYGRQTPTKSVTLPYLSTEGPEAIELYNETGQAAQPWQELISSDLLALGEDGLYTHSKYGFQVSRRNGKGEILAIRELYGIVKKGEHVLHTAHRTSTSSAASKRLNRLLKMLGYEEILRPNPKQTYENAFVYSKQYGLERITFLETGGICEFRTRTSAGGLGEGFDVLIIDEAQEYTTDMENTLKYTVSDSQNPQIILTGTPPTAISKGTVFLKLRNSVLTGESETVGWAEWSVDFQSDPRDVDLWYECNPGMGYQLNERKVREEIGDDEIDFNIQRLGWWPSFNQVSEISESLWDSLKIINKPQFEGGMHLGIKYGKDGINVALSLALKTSEENIFVESIDCRPIKEGNEWILSFLREAEWESLTIDGNGGQILQTDMKDYGIKGKVNNPNVSAIITANSLFLQSVNQGKICHNGQPSLKQIVTNCQKRTIGSNGGFGFESIKDGADVCLLDSVMLASYGCSTAKKKKKKQKISF